MREIVEHTLILSLSLYIYIYMFRGVWGDGRLQGWISFEILVRTHNCKPQRYGCIVFFIIGVVQSAWMRASGGWEVQAGLRRLQGPREARRLWRPCSRKRSFSYSRYGGPFSDAAGTRREGR